MNMQYWLTKTQSVVTTVHVVTATFEPGASQWCVTGLANIVTFFPPSVQRINVGIL